MITTSPTAAPGTRARSAAAADAAPVRASGCARTCSALGSTRCSPCCSAAFVAWAPIAPPDAGLRHRRVGDRPAQPHAASWSAASIAGRAVAPLGGHRHRWRHLRAGGGLPRVPAAEIAEQQGRQLDRHHLAGPRRFWPLASSSVCSSVFTGTLGPVLLAVVVVATGVAARLGGVPGLPAGGPGSRAVALVGVVGGVTSPARFGFGGVGWTGGVVCTSTCSSLPPASSGVPPRSPAGAGRRSSLPAVRALSVAYIEFFRGVPLITLLLMGQFMIGFFLPPGSTRRAIDPGVDRDRHVRVGLHRRDRPGWPARGRPRPARSGPGVGHVTGGHHPPHRHAPGAAGRDPRHGRSVHQPVPGHHVALHRRASSSCSRSVSTSPRSPTSSGRGCSRSPCPSWPSSSGRSRIPCRARAAARRPTGGWSPMTDQTDNVAADLTHRRGHRGGGTGEPMIVLEGVEKWFGRLLRAQAGSTWWSAARRSWW
jgi:hypothetical protein